MTGALALAASLLADPLRPAEAAKKLNNSDIAILNFALHLEYLEAEFYLWSTTGQGLPEELTTGRGTRGVTTGGAIVPFTTPETQATAEELAKDEMAHVALLRTVLGNKAVARPAINLTAISGLETQSKFLILSRIFEDVGVSAYGGAAGSIRNEKILLTAARILAVEAYHAGNIRFQVIDQEITGDDSAVDAIDQPAAPTNYFASTDNGLSLVRTPAQVAALVGPFFPNGLNSKLPR